MSYEDGCWKTLAETDQLVLKACYEDAVLLQRPFEKVLWEGSYYGDPNCWLIEKDSKWAIIGGEYLGIWTVNDTCDFKQSEVAWSVDIRQAGPWKAEFLIDPHSEHAAIWEIDLQTFKLQKLRPFPDYKGTEVVEGFEW